MMVGLFEEATSDLGNKVTWKTQERKVVDTKKLKEDMGEAFYDHYTKVSKSRVLRISRPKTK
jgi:predicted phage-related endonuclease